MPLPKRRSPGHRKDRRERSPAKSVSLYHRKDSHHHSDSYVAYNHDTHYRSSASTRVERRSRSPVPHSPNRSMSASRRPRFSPPTHHDGHSRRDHSRKGFSPIQKRSPVSMKRRSKSPSWNYNRSSVTYSSQSSSSSYKKSGQSFSHSTQHTASSVSRYHDDDDDDPLPPSYNDRKMSPEVSGYSQETYQSSHALVPEDSYSRMALGRAYLQNQRRCTLNERFKVLEPCSPFCFDENITIGIHRNSQVAPGSPRPVQRDFNPYDFVMIRQKNEGARPIFDREELRQYCTMDDVEEEFGDKELRVVTVASHHRNTYRELNDDAHYGTDYNSPSFTLWSDEQDFYDRNSKDVYEGSRPLSNPRSSHDRWIDGRTRPLSSSPHYYGGGGGLPAYPEPSRGESRDWERMERVQHNPDDLRHSINARFTGSPRRKSGYQDGSYFDREYTPKRRDSKYSKVFTDPVATFSRHSDKYSDWKDPHDMNSWNRGFYKPDSKPELSTHHEGGRSYRGRGSQRPALLKTPVGVKRGGTMFRGGFRSRPVGRFQSRGHTVRRGRGRGGSSSYHSSGDNFNKSDSKIVSET
ncbi:uncharacterized protein LOC115223374 isoform X1 [Argonauta hians]